mmetsp:Transcript_44313/g.96387  ORF Transcript_44313/g.96387 Transcript_44313/m.96387 type:complete len:336 (-) Transcript_44313:276-1283(-)
MCGPIIVPTPACWSARSSPKQPSWEELRRFFTLEQLVVLAQAFDSTQCGGVVPAEAGWLAEVLVQVEPSCQPTIAPQELSQLVIGMAHRHGTVGYSLAHVARGAASLDFLQLVAFVRHFVEKERTRQPRMVFSPAELAAIEATYNHYDRRLPGGSRDGLRIQQIIDLWRYLPFTSTLLKRDHQLLSERIAAVDLDRDGALSLREFLQLLRLYKAEQEVTRRGEAEERVGAGGWTRRQQWGLRQLYRAHAKQGALTPEQVCSLCSIPAAHDVVLQTLRKTTPGLLCELSQEAFVVVCRALLEAGEDLRCHPDAGVLQGTGDALRFVLGEASVGAAA